MPDYYVAYDYAITYFWLLAGASWLAAIGMFIHSLIHNSVPELTQIKELDQYRNWILVKELMAATSWFLIPALVELLQFLHRTIPHSF